MGHFLCGPCRLEKSGRLVLPRSSCANKACPSYKEHVSNAVHAGHFRIVFSRDLKTQLLFSAASGEIFRTFSISQTSVSNTFDVEKPSPPPSWYPQCELLIEYQSWKLLIAFRTLVRTNIIETVTHCKYKMREPSEPLICTKACLRDWCLHWGRVPPQRLPDCTMSQSVTEYEGRFIDGVLVMVWNVTHCVSIHIFHGSKAFQRERLLQFIADHKAYNPAVMLWHTIEKIFITN